MLRDVADRTQLQAHGLSALVQDGALRRISFAGIEVVRLIDHPIRDEDWGTMPQVGLSSKQTEASLTRRFKTQNGAIDGKTQVRISRVGEATILTVTLVLQARRECVLNRAGFVVLHPLAGVAGQALCVRSPQGEVTNTRFPERISAAQPVMNIASLSHNVAGVSVAFDFEGEVFEMEDQRNWTDASFKTYCRPLDLPRPYIVRAGEEVRQKITLTLRAEGGDGRQAGDDAPSVKAVMPAIQIAREQALTGSDAPPLHWLGVQGLQLRLSGDMTLPGGLPDLPITLEIVTGPDFAADLARAAASCSATELVPAAVVALPSPYLQSHQPQGPWPDGPSPTDLIPALRAQFPGVPVGGGMFTNFTEFNRRPPDPSLVDFTTFGTTAIVHAADDMSVLETLEALPQVIASAACLSAGRPMRLGLLSIGMRSNPYGASVAANPGGQERVPMAMEDPRQRTGFAAAFAIGLAAACARGGVASFAPAMTGGPLGMTQEGRTNPLWHAVGALAALAGAQVTVTTNASGLTLICGSGRRGIAGVAANLGPDPVALDLPACAIPELGPRNWIDQCRSGTPLTLGTCEAAILTEAAT